MHLLLYRPSFLLGPNVFHHRLRPHLAPLGPVCLLTRFASPLIISVLARLRRPADRRYLTISKIDFRFQVARRDKLLHRLGPFPSWCPPRIHQLSHRHASRDGLVSSVAILPRRVIQLKGSDAPEGEDGLPRGINPRGLFTCLDCFAMVLHVGYYLPAELHRSLPPHFFAR